jgi:ABC-type bacteriocin/lantibiotic exporter with double-glycine peptidase domain
MIAIFETFINANWKTLLVYVLIMCVLTVERVAIPHFYGILLESIKQANFSKTQTIFCVVVGIFVLFQILDTVLTYIDAKLMPHFEAFTRRHVIDTIIDRHEQHYTELDLGNITSKLIKLPSHLNFLFYKVKAFLFNHVLSVVITASYLFYCHPYLGAIFSSAFAAVALITWGFCTTCSRPSYAREETFDSTQESIQDILLNLQSVYINQTTREEQANIDLVNTETIRRTQDYVFCGIPFRVLFAALFLFVFSGITWTSILLYRQQKIKLAILVSSFMVTFSILRTCISFYFDFETFIYLYGGIKVVSDYLETLPLPNTPTVPTRIAAHLEHRRGIDIAIDQISYRVKPDGRPLFDRLSLTIQAGEHIAITGGVGSGKSTLAHMLLCLRTFDSGGIFLNGTPIQEVSMKELRSKIHYVPQHPRLFNRTLWKNISYGNRELQVEQVYAVLKRLQLRDLETSFRAKMFESVGKQGSALSGGQRQIVLLLRALFNKKFDILILDEPTSSLDEHSRDQVIQLIEMVTTKSTVVVITHDAKLAAKMDRVVRIEDSSIKSIKSGAHAAHY